MNELLNIPLWQMTGGQFLELLKLADSLSPQMNNSSPDIPDSTKNYVYGIRGIAELFNCSSVTANRIKQSGVIDDAISQVGRKIVVDADLAIKLANRNNGSVFG